MAKRRVDPAAIVKVREPLEVLVRGRGLQAVWPDSKWDGKYNVCEWRRRSWKEDVVRFGWRKEPVSRYFLSAHWAVAGPDGAAVLASALNPGYARRHLADYRLPAATPLIGVLLQDEWCKGLLADASYAIDWLDTCSTLEGALAELDRPERNGPAVDSTAYAYIRSYVVEHA